MGKTIAVWGTPCSGKTVLSLKLAQTIYETNKGKSSVIVVFTDAVTPTLPVVFPNYDDNELFSLGTVLSKPDITSDVIFANMVGIKGRMNFGVLGYRIGENKFSFPEYNSGKANEFFGVLCGLADYTIVDCSSYLKTSVISDVALKNADGMIYLFSPDIKCLSFTLSQMPIIKSAGYISGGMIKVMNVAAGEMAMPTAAIRTYIGETEYTLPFSGEIARQYVEGTLSDFPKDKKYTRVLSSIYEKLR